MSRIDEVSELSTSGEIRPTLADFHAIAATQHFIRLDPEAQVLVPAGGPSAAIAPALFGKTEAGASSDLHRRWSDQTKHAFHAGYDPYGAETTCVVVNSIAAEANLMELALEAKRADGAPVPDIEIDFSRFEETKHLGRIGVMRAPHRGYDALLRDSTLGNTRFMESSIGLGLKSARRDFATPLLVLPHMLVLGAWHTQGDMGGRGAKFPRVLVSEISGYGAQPIVSIGGRGDPVGIEKKVTIYRTTRNGVVDWTPNEEEADKEKGIPVPYSPRKKDAKRAQDAGSPSLVNHGAIIPVAQSRRVMIQGAVHSMVLSLGGLRALSFPDEQGARADPGRNRAAWTALAALAVLAMVRRVGDGYHLRSSCDLVPLHAPRLQVLGASLDASTPFDVNLAGARSLLADAVTALQSAGGTWGPPTATMLIPDQKVVQAVTRSRETVQDAEDATE